MKHSFESYKNIATEVLSILVKNNCSSIHDVDIIFNMIMRFPYYIDGIRYIYN